MGPGRVGVQNPLAKEGFATARRAPEHAPDLRVRALRPQSAIETPRTRAQAIGKRAFDLALALVLILLFAPLMVAIALLVRLDSKGPILFRQLRVGQGGRAFVIVKFRTMHVLEDGDVIAQVSEDDPRVTRAGNFLRRTSLDELPQLLNVLAGDMSLVGPRPHAAAHDRYYGALIEDYARRRRVKPGITGWAQVNGLRGPTPTLDVMQARIRHDVWYVEHANFALDMRIMLATPLEILRRRNAF